MIQQILQGKRIIIYKDAFAVIFLLPFFVFFKKSHYFCTVFKHKKTNFHKETDIILSLHIN
jgi:hypothetical protein